MDLPQPHAAGAEGQQANDDAVEGEWMRRPTNDHAVEVLSRSASTVVVLSRSMHSGENVFGNRRLP